MNCEPACYENSFDRMEKSKDPLNLNDLFEKIEEAIGENSDHVSLGDILDIVGRRSYGPVLLVAGLITLAPLIGDIPGVPTIMAMIVFLISVQLLLHRETFWLPNWLLKRSVKPQKLTKALKWVRRPARFIDSYLKPRLLIFSSSAATHGIALVCILIAAAMPLMEMIPFSANGAGAALTAFGLALIARDGLLSLIAFTLTALTAFVIIYNLM